jgi:hypothetical protein
MGADFLSDWKFSLFELFSQYVIYNSQKDSAIEEANFGSLFRTLPCSDLLEYWHWSLQEVCQNDGASFQAFLTSLLARATCFVFEAVASKRTCLAGICSLEYILVHQILQFLQ